MIKYRLQTAGNLIILLIGVMSELAQAQPVTNWGAPLYGVQSAIASSNTIMAVGSTAAIHCWVRNSSANAVEIVRATSVLPHTAFWLVLMK